MRRGNIIALALVAALAVAASAVTTRAPLAPSGPWPADTVATYHVDWRARASANMAVEGRAELGSDVSAKGELVVRSYGAQGEGTLLGVKLGKIEAAHATALGRALAPDDDLAAQLRDADALVVVVPSGAIKDVRFSKGTSALARSVLRALVFEVCAQIAAASGEGDVDTALGRAHVTRGGDGATVTTERTRYDALAAFPEGIDPEAEGSLEAHGQVELDRDRTVRAVRETEDVVIANARGPVEGFQSKTELTAMLVTREKTPHAAPPAYAPDPPRAHVGLDDGGDRVASLQRRAMGVTYETLFADVRAAGVMPKAGATAWIWHDSAFVELHPEHAKPLLEQAAKELDLNGRAAAFDIVVVSGTAEGQRALVEALRGWAGADEHTYVALVQRLGYLQRPTADTIAFLRGERGRFKGTDRGRACDYTAGALAAAAREEEFERAKVLVSELAADLGTATDDADREALVRGLGNAGFDSTVDAVLAQRASPSEEVRAAVASALRRFEGQRVEMALVELATDAEAVVAINALGSLFRRELEPGTWAALSEAYASGRIAAEARETLVSGLSQKRDEAPEAAAILVAIVASQTEATAVRQRAESVLRQ